MPLGPLSSLGNILSLPSAEPNNTVTTSRIKLSELDKSSLADETNVHEADAHVHGDGLPGMQIEQEPKTRVGKGNSTTSTSKRRREEPVKKVEPTAPSKRVVNRTFLLYLMNNDRLSQLPIHWDQAHGRARHSSSKLTVTIFNNWGTSYRSSKSATYSTPNSKLYFLCVHQCVHSKATGYESSTQASLGTIHALVEGFSLSLVLLIHRMGETAQQQISIVQYSFT